MRVLVTGATGNVGRLVVNHLLEAGVQVRALTNDPAKAALPAEVEVYEGFIGKPATMAAALEGVERVYLAPFPRTARSVMQLMEQAKVKRVVALSSSSALQEIESGPESWHYYAVERAVEEAGIDWTILRPGEFMTNSLIWADSIRQRGLVRSGYGDARSTLIDLDDIAAIAARVLLEDRHIGQRYFLSGPEAISRREMVEQIGAALGKQIPFEELGHQEAIQELEPIMGQYAEWYADGLAVLAQHPPKPDLTKADFTGEPATHFAQWAQANVDQFR
jgi:uncharacterized protein YbjT (DUF2867 family)